MDGSFSTQLKYLKQQVVIEFLTHENQIPIQIYRRLLSFYGEDTVYIRTSRCWVRKLRHSGGNLDLNDQPRSGRSVTATHYVNRQKVNKLIKKNRGITRRAIEEKLNIGLARVNEIVAGLS
jgi:hypothetical protein